MRDVVGTPCEIIAVPETEVYKLLPSLTEIAFSRVSDTDNTLTPPSIPITCGYTMTDSKGVHAFPGTDVHNTATSYAGSDFTGKYNIYFRYRNANGSFTDFNWLRWAGNNTGEITFQSNTPYIEVEFILSSANANFTNHTNLPADDNIVDRVTVPITKGGARGGTGGDGNGVQEQQYWYKLTQTGTAPSVPANVDSNTENWIMSVQPVPTKSSPYLWRSIRTKWSRTGWAWGPVELFDTHRPELRLLTAKEWPTGNTTMRVYRGDPGEPYKDMYLSTIGGGLFFECYRSGVARGEVRVQGGLLIDQMTPDNMTKQENGVTVDGDSKPLYTDTQGSPSEASQWITGTFWPSFSTSLLVAIRAYIDELYVKRLQTVSQDGLKVLIEEGIIKAVDEISDQWACFGVNVDANGKRKLVLNFYHGSRSLCSFGPEDVFDQIDTRPSSWATLEYAFWGNSEPTVNNTFTLATESVAAYHRYTEGWKSVGGNYEYNVSGGQSPSACNGKTFVSKAADDVLKTSPPQYIPNGFYRQKASAGHEFLKESVDVENTITEVGMMYVYRYVSGVLTATYKVSFTYLSFGTQGKVNSVIQV